MMYADTGLALQLDTHHVYIPGPAGLLFCGAEGHVVTLSHLDRTQQCFRCPFFVGAAQGQGRECDWRDDQVPLADFVAEEG